MKKVIEFITGIIMAIAGLSGWIILIQNNAQGDLAFIICVICITMFMTGIMMIAEASGLIEE